ncbi:unnamed protein product [Blepharisma stoltei]|uniref:DUF4200 domain-containing protein n=1 Tax=Blepharisma stoltei TaxID=1481888 RepID=A0AAU9JDK8_9CILI|nr:unnamed protein product [Blepharisma stoltei]
MDTLDSKNSLPPLRSSMFDTGHENPFKVPPDEEILNIREIKAKEKEDRVKTRGQKIWEKGTKYNRAGALRKIEEIEISSTPVEEKVTVAEAAHAALVADRVRARENIHKTIEKKREMFLLQMMIDIKKEEIKKLEQFALLREYGLKNSEDMLIEDTTRFNEYWDECKRQSHDAMKEAKKLNKIKIDITHDINHLNEEIQQLQTQIQKHEESLEEYTKYKEFLDKVEPHEEGSGNHFQNSEQLTDIFHGYVENNLILIQNIQELEQNLEQAKHEFENIEKLTGHKLSELTGGRSELGKAIEEKDKRCIQLDGRLKKTMENELSGHPVLVRLEQTTRDVLGLEADEGQQDCLGLLTEVEYRLDTYLRIFKEFDQIDPEYVTKKAIDLEKNRREKSRNETLIKEKKKTQDKLQKYMERSANPKIRKVGRQPMPKSKLPEKIVEKVVVAPPQDELDRNEFLGDD